MKNREIKFRFWDTTNQIMMSDSDGWNENVGINEMFKEMVERYNIILMQFTGLKDKNGKEIYEGDIIEINNYQYHLIRPVEFYRGAFCVQGYNWNERECEVIGNIYENPDLL